MAGYSRLEVPGQVLNACYSIIIAVITPCLDDLMYILNYGTLISGPFEEEKTR